MGLELRDRNYDPYSQKFMSEDSIGFLSGDVNFYRYTYNKPLTFIDPLGLNSTGALIDGVDGGLDLIGAISGSEGAAVGALIGGTIAGLPGSIAGAAIGGQFGPNPSLDPSSSNPNDPRFKPIVPIPREQLPPTVPPLRNPPDRNKNVCTMPQGPQLR